MSTALSILLGAGAGGLYFWLGEAGQEKETNCTYMAPASTDVLAVGAGLILMVQGAKSQNPWVSGIGAAIAGIHTGQYLHYKAGQ